MNQLTVGTKEMFYIGEPLEVWVCHGEEDPSRRSNFISTNPNGEVDIQLIDLSDCFKFMRESTLSISLPYLYGYVADYKNRTIYFDDYRILKWLRAYHLPEQGTEKFFKEFTQKDFSK